MATATVGQPDIALVDIALGPQSTAEQAASIFAQGEEAVVFALLPSQADNDEKSPKTRA